MSSDTEVVFSILTWCWIFYFFNSLKQVPRGGVTESDGMVSCLAWGRTSLKLKVLALGPNELRPSLYEMQMPSHDLPSALAVIYVRTYASSTWGSQQAVHPTTFWAK